MIGAPNLVQRFSSMEQTVVILRVVVKSGAMRSIGYSKALSLLDIEYPTGEIYRYFDVPLEVHGELMSSPSKGKVLNTLIVDKYEAIKLSTGRKLKAAR
jgi:hypothetical protein